MQVRQIVAAALLAATAVGAMSQELDPSETLQARKEELMEEMQAMA